MSSSITPIPTTVSTPAPSSAAAASVSTITSSAASRTTVPASAIRSASAQSSSKKKKSYTGFDAVAAILTASFHSARRQSNIKSVEGANTMAFKQLKSSFTASLNGKKREIYAVTPSPIHQLSPIRPSRSSAQGCDRSPIMFLSGHDSDIEPDYHPNSMFNIPRHDQLYGPYSPNSKGVRRLSILEFLQLSVGDEFILFLPPFNKNDNPVWEEVGDRANKNMRQIIMAPFAKQGTVAERDARLEEASFVSGGATRRCCWPGISHPSLLISRTITIKHKQSPGTRN